MKRIIENPYGKFKSYHEVEKNRINIVIDSCADEQGLLNTIKEHVLFFGLNEAYVTPHGQPMLQNKEPDYDISSYETEKEYEEVEGYELIELTNNLNNLYIQITNASTFNIDSMSYVDMDEVLEYINNESANIGLIRFEDDYIGSYVIMGSEIESFGIDPKYQGKKHGLKAFQTILSTIKGNKLLLVNSRNIKALNLYQKMGFIKTSHFVSYWYHVSFK